MNKAKWMIWGAFLVALCGIGWLGSAGAGDEESKVYDLFNGVTVFDSTEHASPWIPVRGANRVVIRSWTTKTAWHISTDIDSLYSDSISTFRVLFSDSVSFIGRDSLGTLVTASSNIPTTTSHGSPFPVCGDSVMFSLNAQDTVTKLVAIAHIPVNKALRAAGNGSGVYGPYVVPTAPASISTYGDGSLSTQYMRIRVVPLRRSAGSGLMTTPNRVNGLKGFRMQAIVTYKNR